jgi:hypothetical protein
MLTESTESTVRQPLVFTQGSMNSSFGTDRRQNGIMPLDGMT